MCENYCSDNLPFNFQQSLLEEPVSVSKTSCSLSPIQEIKQKFKQFNDFVKFGHINAVTVPGNKDEIQRTLEEIGFDIFAVSETNIHRNTPKCAFEIPNYRFFHQDRVGDRGGCGIYCKKELKCKHIPITYNHDKFEVCAVEVKIKTVKVAVMAIYKSPSTDYKVFSQIFDSLQFLVSKYRHVVILGDMNVNYLRKEDVKYRFFNSEIVEPLGLTQIIEKPTRITETTKSLLDIILVSSEKNVKFWDVTTCPFDVDHEIIYMAYNFKKEKFNPKIITKRNMKNFSEEDFLNRLNLAPWGQIYAAENPDILKENPEDAAPKIIVNKQVTILENIFRTVVDEVAPFKTCRVTRPPSPWLTEGMKLKMDERDKLRADYKINFDATTFEKYKELRNQINHEKRRAKIKHFNSKINSQVRNSKKVHNALKKEGVVNSKKGNLETPAFKNLNLLNTTFSANNNKIIDYRKVDDYIKKILEKVLPQRFKFEPVTELEIIKIVKSIKTNAMGIDNISAKFIKVGIGIIAPFVTDIVNNAIKYNVFPCRWKLALIKPLPKVPHPVVPTDFRPISLLVAFSKILEKVLASQMLKYLRENKLLNKFQSAYTKNYSCTTVLLDITDFIFDAFDNGEIVILVLLDYSKAFDCANHKLILAKARALGFMNSAISLLESYLSDRKQKIKLDDGESEWCSLINGVPQGSILGPLLFTILLTDIKDIIVNCKHHCYADDTQVFTKCKIPDIENCIEKLNQDLENVAKFSEQNCLDLNAGKSKFIIFGTGPNLSQLDNKTLPPVVINNKPIGREKSVVNLGIIFDEKLSFSEYITSIISNSIGKLKHAFRYKNFLSQEAKIIVVEFYVLSNLNYCDILFQNLSGVLKNKLQKLQNWCMRFIFRQRKFDHISPYFKKLNTLKMEQRRSLHSLTQMHKLNKNIGPEYLLEKLTRHEDLHHYNTRRKTDFVISKSRTVRNQNNFLKKCAKSYNEILQIKNTENKPIFSVNDSIPTFKRKYKRYLLSSS